MINQIEELQKKLLQAQEDLDIRSKEEKEKASKMAELLDLASNAYHDINNSLAIIKGSIEVHKELPKSCKACPNKPNLVEVFERLETSADKITNQISDLSHKIKDFKGVETLVIEESPSEDILKEKELRDCLHSSIDASMKEFSHKNYEQLTTAKKEIEDEVLKCLMENICEGKIEKICDKVEFRLTKEAGSVYVDDIHIKDWVEEAIKEKVGR